MLKDNSILPYIQLTPQQKEAHDALRWFFFGAPGSGRSYLTAVLALEQAMSNPGISVYLQRLCPTVKEAEWLGRQAMSLVEKLPVKEAKKFKYILSTLSIIYQ